MMLVFAAVDNKQSFLFFKFCFCFQFFFNYFSLIIFVFLSKFFVIIFSFFPVCSGKQNTYFATFCKHLTLSLVVFHFRLAINLTFC